MKVTKFYTMYPISGVHRSKKGPGGILFPETAPLPAKTDKQIDDPLDWFKRWVADRVQRGEKPTIAQAMDIALKQFPQLSQRGFRLRVWAIAAPEDWRKGGAPRGPRNQKAKKG